MRAGDLNRRPRARSLVEDTLHHRAVPGAGELPVAAALRLLAAKDLRSIGPEVFADALDEMPGFDAARRCALAARTAALEAGIRVPAVS